MAKNGWSNPVLDEDVKEFCQVFIEKNYVSITDEGLYRIVDVRKNCIEFWSDKKECILAEEIDYVALYRNDLGFVWVIIVSSKGKGHWELFSIHPEKWDAFKQAIRLVDSKFFFFRDKVFWVDDDFNKIRPIKISGSSRSEMTQEIIDCFGKDYHNEGRDRLSNQFDLIVQGLENVPDSAHLRLGLAKMLEAQDHLMRAVDLKERN
jgi:hypothetical protein